MLEFNILKGQYLNRLDKNVVSADTTDLKAQFELTADFTGTITVWWRRSDVNNTYTSTLAADGTCTIPAEALAATDKAVYGPYDHDVFVSISDTGRTTTNEYKLTVQRSAFSTNATPGTGGNPTAYEELVEQFDELKADNQAFKDSMTEQQETFENTVTENVDNIRYVVETETAPPIIEEASGAEITLDDSAYRQVRGLNLYGYSKQVTTTGANIACLPDIESTSLAGVTWQCKDGIVTVNGTAVEASSSRIIGLDYDLTKKKGRFYVSGSRGDVAVIVSVSKNGETSYYKEQSFVLDGTETKVVLYMQVFNGGTASNEIVYPMLNSGTSALPWEPYSGGVASPSPDWAQPIHSAADEVNLLNFPDVESVVVDGVTWSCKGGAVSAKGNATGQAPTSNTDLSYVFPIKAGTYKISGADSKTYIVAKITKSDDSITYPSSGFTLDGTEKEVLIYVRVASNGAISSTIYPMINSGNTALPYRPYGHNVTVKGAGANLIETIDGQTNNGISATLDDDGYIVLNGTATSDAFLVSNCYVDAETQVFISAGNPTGNSAIQLIFLYNAAEVAFSFSLSAPNVTKFTATQSRAWTRFNLKIYKGTSLTNYRLRPMLNRGSTPLPWQPYAATSSALIALTDSLRGIPVTSGGNYTDESGQQWIADYIYRRQTDGKWMLWRNCGSIVYDGSEDEAWSQSPSVSYRFIINGSTSPALSAAIASSFKVSTKGTTDVGKFVVNDGINSRYFNSNQNGLEAWKTWLADNPQTVVYQLATPTVEELPENVQTELNGLYTYNLHTDMWNNDGAYMDLKYVADTKTWINNKIAGISTAMIENL